MLRNMTNADPRTHTHARTHALEAKVFLLKKYCK